MAKSAWQNKSCQDDIAKCFREGGEGKREGVREGESILSKYKLPLSGSNLHNSVKVIYCHLR